MAVIFYGTREYGLVDEYQGELASTTFFHVWFVPLVPVGSTWITHQGVGQRRGHEITLHGKSVAAGYARVWGPIAAVGSLGAVLGGASIVYAVIAVVAALACAASWRWRTLHGERARRESDFNYVAFGTRVHPKRLLAETRAQLKAALDRQWAARAPKNSPNDIARHGTSDPAEAVIAYGLLRLGALERRGGTEDADADRILDGEHVPTAPPAGPYRGSVEPTSPTTASTATLSELVAARAAEDAHAIAAVAAPSEVRSELRRRRRRYRLGLVGAAVVSIAGFSTVARAIKPTVAVTLAQLRAIHPPTGRTVDVQCDSVTPVLWQELTKDGDVDSQIVMCEIGAYHLPVKLQGTSLLEGTRIHGELRDIPERALWVTQGLYENPDIESATLSVYVDTGHWDRGPQLALGLLFGLLGPAALGLYIVWTRRHRDALA